MDYGGVFHNFILVSFSQVFAKCLEVRPLYNFTVILQGYIFPFCACAEEGKIPSF